MELLIALALGGCAAVAAVCKFVSGMAVQEITLEDVPEGTQEYAEAEMRRQSLELQLEMAEELGLDAATLNNLREQLVEAESDSRTLAEKEPPLANEANSPEPSSERFGTGLESLRKHPGLVTEKGE